MFKGVGAHPSHDVAALEPIQGWSSLFSAFASLVGASAAGVNGGYDAQVHQDIRIEGFYFDRDERLFQDQALVVTPTHATVFI